MGLCGSGGGPAFQLTPPPPLAQAPPMPKRRPSLLGCHMSHVPCVVIFSLLAQARRGLLRAVTFLGKACGRKGGGVGAWGRDRNCSELKGENISPAVLRQVAGMPGLAGRQLAAFFKPRDPFLPGGGISDTTVESQHSAFPPVLGSPIDNHALTRTGFWGGKVSQPS